MLKTVKTGGRFEEIGAYARVRRVGPFVFVAGTTAVQPDGKIHAPGDTYAQSMYVFKRIEKAMQEAGAEMRHVVRTRAFLTDMSKVGDFVRAHGEVFKGIDPVSSGVGAGLTQPGMMVEIEVDALIHSESGEIDMS
ncbi:MAG: Rid family hydrolase [Hyphomicrobiaceae bacterium]